MLGASSLNLAEVAEAIMKKITLFALCMIVLGSGVAMADAWNNGGNPGSGSNPDWWSASFTIREGSGKLFDVISVTDILGGSFYYVQGQINALRQFDDGYGNPAGWSETGTGGTIAYTGGGPNGAPLHYSTTAVGFSVAFSGVPPTTTTLTFYINLFEAAFGTSEDLYTSTTPIDYYKVTYDPTNFTTPWTLEGEGTAVPEPSLVLLLGIGLGAVGLTVWRRRI